MHRKLITVLFLTLPAFGATHWVSPTGAAAYSSCVGSTPLSGTSACSLATANTNAVAGDLIYLRAGTYNGGGAAIAFGPNSNGTNASNRITFMAYTGETPTITNYQNGFWFSGNSYIRVSGMTFSDIALFRIDNGGNHNEVDHNLFQNTAGGGQMSISGAANQNWATHNWVHDNHFLNSGTGCTDGGNDSIDIGQAQGAYSNLVDNDNYNTIEGNFFEHAQHSNFDNYGLYTVFRNNIMHNEPWSSGCAANPYLAQYSSSNPNYTALNGKYGHRNFQITEDYQRLFTNVLVEGNRAGYAGVNQANDGADNFSLASIQNIVRYNFFYASMNPGILFKYGFGGALNNGGNGGTYNRVYNNTFYKNGYGYPLGLTAGCGVSSTSCPWPESNISTYTGSTSGVGNVLKNNLFAGGAGYTTYGSDVMDKGSPSNGWGFIGHPLNNWCSGAQTGGSVGADGQTGCSNTSGSDPLFTNPDLSSFTSQTLPDLSLQSTSPAIDGGIALTTSTNSGSNSTSLTVNDALYFQDGTWGSDLARASTGLGGTMQADWICIQTVTNCVQISAVSYGAYNAPSGTITLAAPKTWANGSSIWLYKKSDGTIVLNGSAPDYGASESSPPVCNYPNPYPCARTDSATLSLPATPNMGNLTGANTTIVDADFGERIVRITDASVANSNFLVSNGGGNFDVYWNLDSTRLAVTQNGGSHYVYKFDPGAFQATRLYGSFSFTGDMRFSMGTNNRIYVLNNLTVGYYDVSSLSGTPSLTTVVNLGTAGTNCLPGGYTQTWNSFAGVGLDDQIVVTAFSNAGAQNTGFDLVAWHPTKGCMHVNTSTGAVIADLGWAGGSGLTCTSSCTGTITTPDRFLIHSTELNRSGYTVAVSVGSCITTCNNNGNSYYWNVGTTALEPLCSTNCGGHESMGNNRWINRPGTPAGTWRIRNIGVGSGTQMNPNPSNYSSQSPQAMHIAWRNNNDSDTKPAIISHVYFHSGGACCIAPADPPLGQWWNEIIGIQTDNSGSDTVWRFGRMYVTGDSPFFTAQQGISAVSQDGRFMAFTSDWLGTLGSTAGASTCTVATNCRADVFVMDLRLAAVPGTKFQGNLKVKGNVKTQ